MTVESRLSDVELKVLAVLQGGLPKSRNPYRDMAAKAEIEPDELLSVLKDWIQQGKIRRIGAIVNHFKVGLGAGAMVVWRVEPERIEQVGRELASFEQVSHAYARRTPENWPYNLYTMVHAKSREEARELVRKMSETCGLTDYRILDTQRELKKAPPTYIIEEER
jgi:DNA-binding Lrp family transcriptional regulator